MPGASPAIADSAPVDPAAVTSPRTVTADALPAPQIDGVVWDQVVAGDVVYVAGDFSSARPAGSKAGVNETPRSNFLAYDLHTGALLPYAPTFNASVQSLSVSPDGKRLYAAGLFSQTNGAPRYRLAAFDLPSGNLVGGFQPYLDSRAQTVVATNDAVYVGGVFTSAGKSSRASDTKVARTQAAAFSTVDGTVLPWAPKLTGGSVKALVVSPDASKIVLGGSFTSLNGSTMPGTLIGAVDAVTGSKALPWGMNSTIPNGALDTKFDFSIYSLNSDGTNVYGTMGPGNFEGTFKAKWTDGSLQWLADCHGDTYSVQPVGDVVYTASHAHDCGNANSFEDYLPPYKWYRALALTTATTQTARAEDRGYKNYVGKPSPTVLDWFPAFNTGVKTGTGQGPWDVTAAQGYVLYGGEFTQVNERGQQGLVRFALPEKAPNKVAPFLGGVDMKPTIVGSMGTAVKFSWPTNFDWDNASLTYQIIRDGDTARPVFETTQQSRFWQRGTLTGADSSLTPGTTYSYQIRTVDPFGNATLSDPASYTATASAAGSLTSYDRLVLQDQPEMYLPMNETSGTAALDWVGSNAVSSLPGNADGIETDAKGLSSTFDGVSQRAATQKSVTPRDVYSSELWFKTTSKTGGVLLGMGSSRAPGGSNDRHIYMDAAGRVWSANYDGTTKAVSSTKAYNDGGWHHIVNTLSPSGLSLYVDGVLVGSRKDTVKAWPYTNMTPYWLVGAQYVAGRPNAPTKMFFQGAIDNLAIYDAALSPAVVSAHYQAGKTAPNERPSAVFVASSSGMSVAVDGSGSADVDGSVVSYAWNFGDGATGSGASASHEYARPGVFTVALTVTDDRGGSATSTRSVEVKPAGVLAQDTFGRTSASGWGSAEVGGAWKVAGGSTSSVGAGAGVLTSVKGQTSAASLPGVSSTSTDSTVSFRLDSAATGGGQYVTVTGRQVGAESYTARVWAQSNGLLQLQLQKTGTTLAAVNLPAGYKPGDTVRVRLQVTGSGTTTIAAKVWTTGTEPAAWTRTATDATAALQAAGTVGLGLYVSGSATTTTTATLDDYTVKTVQ